MATKDDLAKLNENCEVARVKRLEESITMKLNFDGLYGMHPAIDLVRMGSLTREESDFLGRLAGWDNPYFRGIDWERVPTPMLAAAAISTDDSMIDMLRSLYPAPEMEAA